MTANVGYTDNIYQTYKLYIEGVQVPWENMVISQGIGALPSATISIPALAGLMDISRFYQPKVHIFFEDQTALHVENGDALSKNYSKLLFHGVITGVSYSKSRQGSGGVNIQFTCAHRNSLLSSFKIDYSGWESDVMSPKGDGAHAPGAPNTQASIQQALEGINTSFNPLSSISKENPDGELTILTEALYKYHSKLQGMPGVIVNYWNQLKRDAYNKDLSDIEDVFLKMYQPLVDNGLKFFERVGGHLPLEIAVENGRQDLCPSKPGTNKKILVPPCNKVMLMSAAQTAVTINLLSNYLSSVGEMTDIFTLMREVYAAMDYEILTLSSPAEAPFSSDTIAENSLLIRDTASTSAIETIIKPVIPFYYSPVCNVLLPKMYHSIDVQYDTAHVPTRLTVKNSEMQGNPDGLLTTRFRAPASIRRAIADKFPNGKLADTMGYSRGAVGKYEQGVGILPMTSQMPPWLGYLTQTLTDPSSKEDTADGVTITDPQDLQILNDLAAGWAERYPSEPSMNPYAENSVTMAHHRMLYASADYMYSEQFARTRGGSVQCPFNPYIVPGYPMDIIDASPTMPSFHALCMTVTHNISSTSVSTSVTFTAAMSYSELANYYIPFMHPFIQGVLGLAKSPTLINTTDNYATAVNIADQFYYNTLGVTCATPDMLYNFTNGTIRPLRRDANGKITSTEANDISLSDVNGGELNPNLTYQGNLTFAYRSIEAQSKIEERFNLKFIDMTYDNYSPTVIKYKDAVLSDAAKLEIGANQFLDYYTMFGEEILPEVDP